MRRVYTPFMASKYLCASAQGQRSTARSGRLLLRLFMQSFCFLLELLEAPLGIDIYGIFGDLALQVMSVSMHRKPAHIARHGLSRQGVVQY